ncbi:MAG: CheC domain protein [Chlamydiales bacterium]|jgi:chemotaxis protein CheX|nr:CheC domain protein [Chlamydiales bacterium]
MTNPAPLDLSLSAVSTVNLINAFINSTIDVLKQMANLDQITRKKMTIVDQPSLQGDLASIIGISGLLTGNIAISLPRPLAELIISRMLGMAPEEVNATTLSDGVGELVNLVAGKAKSNLIDSEGKALFSLSLPTVVSGQDHMINQKSGTKCMLIVFDVSGKDLMLQLTFSK